MRAIKGNDPVFERLMNEKDVIVFNLFELIRSDEKALIYTDDESYISAQSNPNTPLWIYITNEPLRAAARTELQKIITGQSEGTYQCAV